jgi:hypothetical protein
LTLDSQTANAIKSGGHVDFAYYISGGSYLDHTYRFTNRSDVTKRVRSVVDGPLNYGFSSGFSWEVEAVGYGQPVDDALQRVERPGAHPVFMLMR